MSRIWCALALVVCLIGLQSATAGPIPSQPAPETPNSVLTEVWVGASWNNASGSFSDVEYVFGTGSASLGPTTWAGDANSGTGYGRAAAGYGTISLYSSVLRIGEAARTDLLPDYWFRTYAYGRFVETMLIDDPALTGQPGTVTFEISGTGTITRSGSGITTMAPGSVYVKVIGASGYALQGTIGSTGLPFARTTNPIAFTYGVPFSFYVSLGANANLKGSEAGSSEIDMWHTATLSGMEVYDSLGAIVEDYTLETASGASYPYDSSTVPEPASVVLGALGVLGLLAWNRRRAVSE